MKVYYRITCENIGIYEFLKQYIFNNFEDPKEKWNSFLNLECNNWLNKPDVYKNENKKYFSYFTEEGYNLFLESTFKEIKKIIKEKDYRIDIINLDDRNIIYKDKYQIVVESNKLIKSREFCSKVKDLAKEYNLPFFVVTEGSSAISNNGCEAVKHARDCHIEWEKNNNFDPYEDWSRNKGIGSSILKNLISNSNVDIYLWVYEENIKAFNLYKSLGFSIKDKTNSRYFMEFSK